MLLKRIFVFSH